MYNQLSSMSFFISSYDSPSVVSPTLYLESRLRKKEWSLNKICLLDKFFLSLDLCNNIFYEKLLILYEKLFYFSFSKLLYNYFILYFFINNKFLIYNYIFFYFFINFLKVWKQKISFLKYNILKNFMKLNVLKYYKEFNLNLDYKLIFQESLKNNIIKNIEGNLKSKIEINLSNIYLYKFILKRNLLYDIDIINNNKIFKKYIFSILKEKIKKKIISFYTKKNEKIKNKVLKFIKKLNSNNIEKVFLVYSEFLNLQNLNKMDVNSWILKNLKLLKVNYLKLLNIGRVNINNINIKLNGLVKSYNYNELYLGWANIINFSFLNNGWGDLFVYFKGSRIKKKSTFFSLIKKEINKFLRNNKYYIKDIFNIILQFLKINFKNCNNSKNSNRNYILNIKKVLLKYLIFIKKYNIDFINKGIKGIIRLDNLYFSYIFFKKYKYKYPYIYSNFLVYKKNYIKELIKLC